RFLHARRSPPLSPRPLLCPPPPTTSTPTLSLHDALPIFATLEFITTAARDETLIEPLRARIQVMLDANRRVAIASRPADDPLPEDRKSTRLNSSHVSISYAVFCLKKKTYNHEPVSEVYSE